MGRDERLVRGPNTVNDEAINKSSFSSTTGNGKELGRWRITFKGPIKGTTLTPIYFYMLMQLQQRDF